MNEMVKEKIPYSKGKTVALSTVCVILVFLLTTVLLGCLTANRIVHDEALVQEAFSQIPLEEVVLSDGTPLVTKISRDYLGGDVLTEEQVKKILQSDDYTGWTGEKARNYAHFIAEHGSSGVIFPEILTREIEELVRSSEDDIRLQSGIHDFADTHQQMFINLKSDLTEYNHRMRDTISTGFTAKLLFAAVSGWIWFVTGGLLLLLFIWMLVIHVRGTGRVGTACKTFAVTAFVPSVLLLLWGVSGGLILKLCGLGYLTQTAKTLSSSPILFGGLACLACVAVFIFGAISNTAVDAWQSRPKRERPAAELSKKREMPSLMQPSAQPMPAAAAPAPAMTAPAAPVSEAPAASRHFCRFCGGELVNTDARFCYKCGKEQ